jgi:mercuric ion binding protein
MRKTLLFLISMAAPSLAMAAETSMTLDVKNMTCATCPVAVKIAIKRVGGVKDVKVYFDKKIAVVVFDDAVTNAGAIALASTNAGFAATIKE